jgi:hypothetical protein
MSHFKNYLLVYTITPLLVLTLSASYYRFLISEEYTLAYEGNCDPYTQTCFVGCNDEDCTDIYYYSYIARSAATLSSVCGDSIESCVNAHFCTPGEQNCTVTFCDPRAGDVCEELSISDRDEVPNVVPDEVLFETI